MSSISKRRREGSRTKIKTMGDHKEFLKRITKTLYYGQLPTLPCLSLPVTEISCDLWSESQRGRSLRRLHADAAADIARSACVSPCALVLAILYLERLNACNPDYLAASAPAELFLVSLMVSNKFLQDDGEDEEVICEEWASSGGLELDQLKKLELEFLSAIDWNVFVSEKSFEIGLKRLERQVALRQAQTRGFFTYSDLNASCDSALLGELMCSTAAGCLAFTLGYLASILTFVTSTLVISQAWLPVLHYVANTASTALDTAATSLPSVPRVTLPMNTTLDSVETEDVEVATPDAPRCCTEWLRYQDAEGAQVKGRRTWQDSLVVYDWKSFEPWWSRTSVLNWLYQSSLVNPLQRWLEKMKEFSELVGGWVGAGHSLHHARVHGGSRQQCVRQWLNLSKLSVLVASVSDR